jgi:hypothetical protein
VSLSATQVLKRGCTILEPVLARFNFQLNSIQSGKGSGGTFASTEFVNGDRKIELNFRYSLGMVTYCFGSYSLSHEDYMRVVVDPSVKNRYPGFSDEPLDAFEGLKYDLEHFANSF